MKLTAEQVNKLKGDVLITAPLLYPEWREGQAYFNLLFKDYPELAEEIRGTEYDPFYADHMKNSKERINKFLNYIQE